MYLFFFNLLISLLTLLVVGKTKKKLKVGQKNSGHFLKKLRVREKNSGIWTQNSGFWLDMIAGHSHKSAQTKPLSNEQIPGNLSFGT